MSLTFTSTVVLYPFNHLENVVEVVLVESLEVVVASSLKNSWNSSGESESDFTLSSLGITPVHLIM